MSNTFNSIVNLDNHLIPPSSLVSTINDIFSQLSCPICQDVPTQPYLLPGCGHTFCYDCIKAWFPCNPSCPVCRSTIGESKPILNHSLKNIIDASIINLLNISSHNTANSLRQWQTERNKDYESDKASDFPWLKKIAATWGRAVVDNEDGVPRCSACHWELIDGHCENCGRTMVGWQDRSDGDDVDEEEEEEDADENLFRGSRSGLSSDYEDYDNGVRDMRNRFVHPEADVSGDDDEENDNDGDNTFGGLGEDYESDDGFVVDDDGDEGTSDVDNSENVSDNSIDSDEDIAMGENLDSGDEEIIHASRKTASSKSIFTDSEDGSDDIVDLSDIVSDDDLIKQPKRGVKKKSKSGNEQIAKRNTVTIDSSDDDSNYPNQKISIKLDNDDSEDEIFSSFKSKKKTLHDEEDESEEEEEDADDDVDDDDDDDDEEEEEEEEEKVKHKRKHRHKYKHKSKHKKRKH